MKYKKIVVKVGTSVLAAKDGRIKRDVVEKIAAQVSCLLDRGLKVVIVSSGAICAGREISGNSGNSLSDLQAMASIGQSELMRLYGEAFKKRNYCVGQILLTQDDFDDRRRYLNIKYTINALLTSKKIAVPIVNENDTVSTEEIKLGDNDRLSGLVADICGADALVLLTDVDGLRDRGNRIVRFVEDISEDIEGLVDKKGLSYTKGGMKTKLDAIRKSMHSGIDCYIARGTRDNVILDLLEERGPFTYFRAKPVRAKARKRWIAHSSKVKGKILVDDGAKAALISRHSSLLASGVTGKSGSFMAGDVVGICDSKKKEFARGLSNYSSKEIDRIKGLRTSEIEKALGYKDHDEVVHRDNLVIL